MGESRKSEAGQQEQPSEKEDAPSEAAELEIGALEASLPPASEASEKPDLQNAPDPADVPEQPARRPRSRTPRRRRDDNRS